MKVNERTRIAKLYQNAIIAIGCEKEFEALTRSSMVKKLYKQIHEAYGHDVIVITSWKEDFEEVENPYKRLSLVGEVFAWAR